jgi:hypothetical protein
MIFKFQNVNHLLLLICISFLLQCSRYTVTNESNSIPTHSNENQIPKKIGLVFLHSVPKEKLPHFMRMEMQEMILLSAKSLEESDWSSIEKIDWIQAYSLNDNFDYSQEYLSTNKKNVLEIHTNLQYKSGLGSYTFYILTLSLIPSVLDYNLVMKSSFYDSNGVRHALVSLNDIPVVEKKGLFHSRSVSSNEELMQFVGSNIAELIHQSYAMIKQNSILHLDYESSIEEVSRPFRMQVDYFSCADKFSFEYGVGSRSTVVFDPQEYNFCKTEIRFSNQKNQIKALDSKDFSFISNSQSIKSIETVPVYSVQLLANGKFLRRDTNHTFANSIVLKTGSAPSLDSLELYFLVPKGKAMSDIRIRWTNPQNPDDIVESWIGDVDAQ